MIATLLLAPALLAAFPQEPTSKRSHPTKVPTPIRWHANLDAAQAASKEDGRPVIAYFTFDT